MTPAIEISGLRKAFGAVVALDALDLSVAPGEVHGFLGPNGAGKTTAIRTLLGLLRPDSGRAEVLGGDPWVDAVAIHRRVAYVPGDVALWPSLTGGEIIDVIGRLRGTADRARRDSVVERFQLDPTRRARTYSKGNRQKVALIAALASRADLLLLDEPTSGLDPLMEVEFRECIAEVRAEGRTVLLSSHIFAEVEALCDRITIIRAGRTVETGRMAELGELGSTIIEAQVVTVPTGLGTLPGVRDMHVDGQAIRLTVDSTHLNAVMAQLVASGLVTLQSRPPALEEIFLGHYRDREIPSPVGAR